MESANNADKKNNRYDAGPYQPLIDGFVRLCRETAGEELVGVYLHGSLAMGCFQPETSDIDLIVVTQGEWPDEQKLFFMDQVVLLNQKAPAKGLELSVVKKENCLSFQYPTPFELHFSPAHLKWYERDPQDYVAKMKGVDYDLAAHFTILKRFGLALYGEPVEEVFGPVPKEAYRDSILRDVAEAGEEIRQQPVYVILNLCRVLAFCRDGVCLSKRDGGLWGLEHVDDRFRPLIREALKCYSLGQEMRVQKENEGKLAVRFAETMLEQIRLNESGPIHSRFN